MIPVDGRVIAGLDEFMLRSGHLKLLCRVAAEQGGSTKRIERDVAEKITRVVTVPDDRRGSLARYLAIKRLCVLTTEKRSDGEDGTSELRYPSVRVSEIDGRNFEISTDSDEVLGVWWQDLQISDPRTPSKVGALSFSGRSSSKTGLSHIFDWAQLLDLLTATSQLTPIGRLLATLPNIESASAEEWNPYVPGNENIFLGFAFFQRDIDLFVKLVPKLIGESGKLNKGVCTDLFVSSLQEVVAEAERSTTITSNSRFQLVQQVRELEKASRKSRKPLNKISTAWHRAASRFETYSDLGLLSKDGRAGDDEYRYCYTVSPRMIAAWESIQSASSAEEWIQDSLVDVLVSPELQKIDDLSRQDLLAYVERVVRALALPTNLYPLDALSLGIAYLASGDGKRVSIGNARKGVENLARETPDIARLARGREGSAAEYISLDLPQSRV